MSGSVSPIEHHTGPSQNTRAQKRKLEEILDEVPNHEFDDQLLCFELTTSLNSDEDVVKVMGADVPLTVQAQAFPELASLYRMQQKAAQDQKDYEEMLEMTKMRQREYDIEAVRNDLIILNRFYPRGGILQLTQQESSTTNMTHIATIRLALPHGSTPPDHPSNP